MNKELSLLGFASKAGKLSYGFDAVCTSLSKKNSKLLLVANDISPKSLKEVVFFGEKFKTDVIVLENINMETLSHAIGRKCGMVSVNDEAFSKGLLSAIKAGRNLNDK